MLLERGHRSISRRVLLWALCVSSVIALQQQSRDLSKPVHQRYASYTVDRPMQGRVEPADTLPDGHQNAYTKDDVERPPSHHDERALATFPPTKSISIGGNDLVSDPSSTGGLTSRQSARSLQDWRVEDIVLLATVDGKMYARDRITGAHKWLLEVDRPMVETIYHRRNKSVGGDGMVHIDPLWIVEPSQDGSIYVYAPGSGLGLQRLGYTVKQLADLSPYASEGHPAVAYTAEKKTTLYTIDAASGHILKKFSSAGSITNNMHERCRRVTPLDSLDDEECEATGILTLGHTEYTIGIQDRSTGEQISTIQYFEWGPNNRDADLRNRYTETMDGRYISTKYNGDIYGLNSNRLPLDSTRNTHKPTYLVKLSAPVARVYDVVRPVNDRASDPALVVLPQPLFPAPKGILEHDEGDTEEIFVNCTESGSWYALSERTYPAVTEGAKLAQCYRDGSFNVPALPLPKSHRDMFTGIHWLASHSSQVPPLTIDPPNPREEDASIDNQKHVRTTPEFRTQSYGSTRAPLLVLPLLLILSYIATRLYGNLSGRSGASLKSSMIPSIAPLNPEHNGLKAESNVTLQLREDEPAQETIFPRVDQENCEPETRRVVYSDEIGDVRGATADQNGDEGQHKDGKKPKHKRGKRGGRKAKERELELAGKYKNMEGEQKFETLEIISVAASESAQVTGPLQINSLVINTDRVIGQGSCGTLVFEGSFEGRSIAVKRMLSQYYELASQEVSFLQQSDDHPNVIRYFCQQRDDHFLYIAVELCQASLFEVWEAEKARTEDRQRQLQSLKLAIQQDVPKALQQLAAGLYHLHNLRIIHRDIKPQNILVAYPKRGQTSGPRLVISDFGLGKNLPENVSTLIDPTGNAGTSGWKAPELISQPRDGDGKLSNSNSYNGGSEIVSGTTSGVKRAADIFSLGCLFFWVLTDGNHPFEDENGWHQLRELNIKRNHKNMSVLERWSDAFEPMQLITSMLAHEPEHRPTALQVVNHPFFWSAEKRLGFLCDVSDHFERETRGTADDHYAGDSPQLRLLEYHAEEVIGPPTASLDFLAKLDRHFVDTLGKQRKYSGSRLLDLLRALRNKKNHYEDMSEDVKKRVGPLPVGYLGYWCNRFPRLLMACYDVVHGAGIQDNDRFRGYFIT